MKKPLSELTIDELMSKLKSLKMGAGIFVGVQIMLVASIVLIFFLKGSRLIITSLIALPIVMIPVLLSTRKSIKDIEAEIASRNQK
jgi:hypothetical protein